MDDVRIGDRIVGVSDVPFIIAELSGNHGRLSYRPIPQTA